MNFSENLTIKTDSGYAQPDIDAMLVDYVISDLTINELPNAEDWFNAYGASSLRNLYTTVQYHALMTDDSRLWNYLDKLTEVIAPSS